MAKQTDVDKGISEVKKSIDLLILIELCKAGAGRDQIRAIMGSLDNNQFTKVKSSVMPKKAKE